MNDHPPDALFVQSLIDCQDRLCAYAAAMVGSLAIAEDLVQQTNLVIWREAKQFVPGTDFSAWACRILYYEVLAWRKRRSRERLVFDDAIVANIAEQAERISVTAPDRHRALIDCLSKLTDSQRDLLNARYQSDTSLNDYAARIGRPVDSLYQTLRRVRLQLGQCVDRFLNREQRA
ncbi:MAG: sigma-70 family RNA polymerase sigma factor [Planctomycetes bacterium]|nr:sigma-70 family RNA polymerase sigma factor [Planctomycetota bacterium]